MLSEASTTEISKSKNPRGFSESREIARQGGSVALNARRDIEKRTKKSAVTPKNANGLGTKSDQIIEN
jgi:hypothetical protein